VNYTQDIEQEEVMVYQEMELAKLLANLNYYSDKTVQGLVSGISIDSRQVEPGQLFIALQGLKADGHQYIEQAVQRGAVAVVYQAGQFKPNNLDCHYLCVPDSHLAAAQIASAFYQQPSRQLLTVGVTGTKGKTSTSHLIASVLGAQGARVGSMTTLGSRADKKILEHESRLTTPTSLTIQHNLWQMVRANCQYAVIECSSHALSSRLKRVDAVDFDAGVITNITHEHLDFHGSIEQYRQDKARLFSLVAEGANQKQLGTGQITSPKLAVINQDDPQTQILRRGLDNSLCQMTYGLHKSAMIYASHIELGIDGLKFRVHTPSGKQRIRLRLIGDFYLYNCLAALAIGVGFGIDLAAMAEALASLQNIKGRMEKIEHGQPFAVWIDYAHNPDSFNQVMKFAKRYTKGRLIVVFGSAGERDTEKRALQGQIAANWCNEIYLTDEDPRQEDSMAIIKDIAKGITGLQHVHIIPDRRAAIQSALIEARAGDTVLLLGKGHEHSILYSNKIMAWDEFSITHEILTQLGYAA